MTEKAREKKAQETTCATISPEKASTASSGLINHIDAVRKVPPPTEGEPSAAREDVYEHGTDAESGRNHQDVKVVDQVTSVDMDIVGGVRAPMADRGDTNVATADTCHRLSGKAQQNLSMWSMQTKANGPIVRQNL